MAKIENIKTVFPDPFGIKNRLRHGHTHNEEFLDLALKSYQLLYRLQNQELNIAESLKSNQNVSIFDHQILAAQRIKNVLGGSAILADEVGLGKTVEAGIIIKEFLVTGLASKVLILAPPSLLSQWQDEMRSKFDLDFAKYNNDPKSGGISSYNLLIMSHSSAIFPKQSTQLNSIYWDLVVVDEAHSMKNEETHKHVFTRNLPKRNLLLLTATPVQNNLKELYNWVDLLRPGYLGTWEEFKGTYVADKKCKSIYPSMRDSLQQLLSRFIIRTTRNEVRQYIRFTDRIPHTTILEPSEKESQLYAALTEVVQGQFEAGMNPLALMIYQRLASSSTEASKRALYKMKKTSVIPESHYQELSALADGISRDTKLEHLLGVMQGDKSKFLVFTEFYATQEYVAANLRKEGYEVTLFNGKMGYAQRKESIERFRGDVQVMVSTSAGGEGQNFQFCSNVVNYDLPWNPMKVEQRVGRVHRIGQKDDVRIYNFALSGTIEAYILQLLYEKINLFKMALGDMDLLFEDSWPAGSPQQWFKEYMESSTEEERENKFTALGEKWQSRKKHVNDAIQDFNTDVFKNFNLSSVGAEL